MKRVVIDVAKWARGKTMGDRMLCNNLGGKHCCLGFDGLVHGVDQKILDKSPAPSDVDGSWGDSWQAPMGNSLCKALNLLELKEDYIEKDSLEQAAIAINDSRYAHTPGGRKLLREVFRVADRTLVFRGLPRG